MALKDIYLINSNILEKKYAYYLAKYLIVALEAKTTKSHSFGLNGTKFQMGKTRDLFPSGSGSSTPTLSTQLKKFTFYIIFFKPFCLNSFGSFSQIFLEYQYLSA